MANDFMLQQRGQDLKGNEHARTLPTPDIGSRLALEKGADFLQFAATRRGVVKEVRELGAVGLDVGGGILGESRVAFQDEQLMFGSALLADRVHVRGEMGGGHPDQPCL